MAHVWRLEQRFLDGMWRRIGRDHTTRQRAEAAAEEWRSIDRRDGVRNTYRVRSEP